MTGMKIIAFTFVSLFQTHFTFFNRFYGEYKRKNELVVIRFVTSKMVIPNSIESLFPNIELETLTT